MLVKMSGAALEEIYVGDAEQGSAGVRHFLFTLWKEVAYEKSGGALFH